MHHDHHNHHDDHVMTMSPATMSTKSTTNPTMAYCGSRQTMTNLACMRTVTNIVTHTTINYTGIVAGMTTESTPIYHKCNHKKNTQQPRPQRQRPQNETWWLINIFSS